MLRSAFLLVILLTRSSVEAKGIGWCYEMTGIAYAKGTRRPLVNEMIIIGQDTTMTDDEGRYEVSVCGITCCRTRAMSVRRCNNKSYGHIEVRRMTGEMVRFRSKWKKYGLRPTARSKDRASRKIWRKDVYV